MITVINIKESLIFVVTLQQSLMVFINNIVRLMLIKVHIDTLTRYLTVIIISFYICNTFSVICSTAYCLTIRYIKKLYFKIFYHIAIPDFLLKNFSTHKEHSDNHSPILTDTFLLYSPHIVQNVDSFLCPYPFRENLQ